MPILYKYLPPERITFLNDELLRFTQPGDLNDPFECIPTISKVDLMAVISGAVERNKAFFRVVAQLRGGNAARKHAERILPREKARLCALYTANPEYLPQFFADRYMFHANKN